MISQKIKMMFVVASMFFVGPLFAQEMMICTMDYRPVCGRPAGSISGVMTYGNMCGLNAQQATFLYDGECKAQPVEQPQACTREYMPVCGVTSSGIIQTYSNMCSLYADNATLKYMNACFYTGDNTKIHQSVGKFLYNQTNDAQSKFNMSSLLIDKIESIRNNALFGPIAHSLWTHNYEVVETHLAEKINQHIQQFAVMGGTSYITQRKWISPYRAQFWYEDGHVDGDVIVQFSGDKAGLLFEIQSQ